MTTKSARPFVKHAQRLSRANQRAGAPVRKDPPTVTAESRDQRIFRLRCTSTDDTSTADRYDVNFLLAEIDKLESASATGVEAVADRAVAWSRERGHSFDPLHVAAKVCEEAGEVIGEAIKRTENRQDGIDRTERLRDELADLGIAWLKLCRIEGHNPVAIMAERCSFNERRVNPKGLS